MGSAGAHRVNGRVFQRTKARHSPKLVLIPNFCKSPYPDHFKARFRSFEWVKQGAIRKKMIFNFPFFGTARHIQQIL